MRLREVGVDAALLLTALGAVALAGYLLLGLGGSGGTRPAGPTALLVLPQGVPDRPYRELAAALGRRAAVRPLATAQAPGGADLAVVQTGEGEARTAAALVERLRQTAPSLRLVVVGPLGLTGREQVPARDLLRATARSVGADFIDPVGSRWLAAPGLTDEEALTPAGMDLVAERLVAAVRRADQLRAQPPS